MSGRMAPRPRPSLAFRRLRAATIAVVAIVLVIALVNLVRRPDAAAPVAAPSAGATEPVPTPTPTPTTPPPQGPAPRPSETPTPESPSTDPAPAEAEKVDAAIHDWHDDESGHLAITVTDLESGRSATYGDAKHKFSTASIVKVDILATLLLQEDGKLSGSQRAIAARMIRQSDNAAATALWRQIGQQRGLAAANEKFGLTSTRGGTQGTWGLTTTTSADQLRLLQVVFTDDSPLTEDARDYLQSLMGSVSTDQDWGVTAADSRGDTHAYVKNGWLPRTGGWIVNSVGKVEHDGHPVLVAALSDGGATQSRGITAVEKVAKQAAESVTTS